MVFVLGDSLLFCCLDVGVAATASSMSEAHSLIRCHYAAHEPMGVGAAVVCADWLALNSLWVAVNCQS
jgi:hypothetical protein